MSLWPHTALALSLSPLFLTLSSSRVSLSFITGLIYSMGASVSKDTNRTAQQTIEESVDYGTTLPNGIYSATQQDFNLRIVRNLIVERKLAPFYKGKLTRITRALIGLVTPLTTWLLL